jgi:hypothetical protein
VAQPKQKVAELEKQVRELSRIAAQEKRRADNNLEKARCAAYASDIRAAAGLIAPIPALTILTGQTMSWPVLVVWTTSVCMVGIVVSIGLRKQLIEVEDLPFPSGFATGKTMQEIYNHGRAALVRLQLLGATAVVAAAIKFAEDFKFIAKIPIKLWFKAQPGGGLEKAGIAGFSPANFGVSLEPTLMMYGVGAIVGAGSVIEQAADVSYSVLGQRCFVSKHSLLGAIVAHDEAELCMKGMQMCLVGRGAALTARATPLDVMPGRALRVRDGDRFVEIDVPVLGACFGHDTFVGADVYTGPELTV